MTMIDVERELHAIEWDCDCYENQVIPLQDLARRLAKERDCAVEYAVALKEWAKG
jgi:hypothetical protein